MELLETHAANGLALAIYPRHGHAPLLKAIARLGGRGAVHVLDGGNVFNAYAVARHIRRETAGISRVLQQIHVAQAFTCYQMHTLLKETSTTSFPIVLIDLLATFYDESVELKECQRLLDECLVSLRRLSRGGPVLVSASPPRTSQPERTCLLETLEQAADTLYIPPEATAQQHPRLF